MTVTLLRVALALALAGAPSCASSLPSPKQIGQPRDAYQSVPHPPPAAFVELIPLKPSRHAVWIDGNWAWRGRGFVWQRGGWVEPGPNARYAPWRVVYVTDGTLMFASCGWFDDAGHALTPPPIVAPATTPPNEVTSEFQSNR